MKRILSISPWPSVWSQGKGGGSPSEAYSIKAMLEAGFKVTHISPAAHGLKISEEQNNIRFVRIPNPFQRYRFLLGTGIAFLYRLPAVIDWTLAVSTWLLKTAERYDVVVGHSSETIYALRRCASILKAPAISRLYGISAPLPLLSTGLRRELYFDLISLLRTPPDTLVLTNDGTCGEEVCDAFGVPRDKYHLMFNGYEPSLLNLRTFESSPGYILTACRLVDWKRVDRVVRIAALVKKSIPDLEFIILGDGPERIELNRLIKRLDLSDTVQLKGRVTRQVMYQHLAGATAILATQDLSNLNNTVLESLIIGKPVVALDTGCTNQLVRHEETGLSYEPRDIKRAADGIVRVVKDNRFRRMLGRRAKALSQNKLQTWPERIEQEARIYRRYL